MTNEQIQTRLQEIEVCLKKRTKRSVLLKRERLFLLQAKFYPGQREEFLRKADIVTELLNRTPC